MNIDNIVVAFLGQISKQIDDNLTLNFSDHSVLTIGVFKERKRSRITLELKLKSTQHLGT